MRPTHVSFSLFITLSFFYLKLFGQTSVNDTVCVSSKNTEVLVLQNDISVSPNTSIEIILPPSHGTAIIPNSGDRIWYSTNTTDYLPSRAGKDSLVYKLIDGGIESEATVYFNTNTFDLLLSSVSSVCTANPNKVLANPTSVTGEWSYNPTQIEIDFPQQSNSEGRLISGFAQIEWIDLQYNCPSVEYRITSASLEVNLNSNGRVICDNNDTTLLRNIYDQPINSAPFGTNVVHKWSVNNNLLNGDTLISSNIGEGRFEFLTEFDTPVCYTSLTDSVEIIKLSADFDLDSVYCSSNDTIFLNNNVLYSDTNSNNTSKWYINSVETQPELLLNTTGTFFIDHVVSSLHCKDSIRKVVTIYSKPNSEFLNPNNFYCDSDESIDLFLSFTPNTVDGRWLVNDLPPSTENTLNFSNLNGGAINTISYITGQSKCTDTTVKSFFLDTLENITTLPLDEYYCDRQSPLLDLNTLNPTPSGGQFILNESTVSFIDFRTLVGLDSLKYIVESVNGACRDSVLLTFTVDTLSEPSFDLIEDFYCNDDSPTILLSNLNPKPTGGIFLLEGNPIPQLDFLNLSGEYELQYTVSSTNDICRDTVSQTFTVDTLAEPSFDLLNDFYCNDETPEITLNTLNPSPANGTFLLNNNPTTSIDFIDLVGNYELEYAVSSTNNICKDTFSLTFTVDSLAEPNFNLLNNFYCNDDEPELDLSTLNPFPSGGDFLLNGLTTSTIDFQPLIGDYELKYAVSSSNGICRDTVSQTFIVDTLAEPSFDLLSDFYCNDEAPEIILNTLNPSPANGTFLLNNTPTTSIEFINLAGEYKLDYSVSSLNHICKDTIGQTFTVDTLAEPSFNELSNSYCDSDKKISLLSLTPFPNMDIDFYTWKINENDILDSLSFSGLFDLNTLNYSVFKGVCSDTFSRSFNVDTLGSPTFNLLQPKYCDEDQLIQFDELEPYPTQGLTNSDWFLNNNKVNELDFTNLFNNQNLKYYVENGVCRDSTSQSFFVDTLQNLFYDPLNSRYCENEGILELDSLNASPKETLIVKTQWLLNNTPFTGKNITLATVVGNNVLTYKAEKGACTDSISQNLIIDRFSSSQWEMDTLLCSDLNDEIVLTDLSDAVGSSWAVESTNGEINDTISLIDSATYFLKHTTTNGACVDSTQKKVVVFLSPNETTFDSISDPLCSLIRNVNLDARIKNKNVFTTSWVVKREAEDYIIPSGGIMDVIKLDASHQNVLEYTIVNENSQTPEKCSYSGSNILTITEPTDTIRRDTVSFSLSTDSILAIPYDSEKQIGISDVPAQLDILPNATNDSLLIEHLQFAIPGRLNNQSIKLVSNDPLSCEVPIIYNIDFEAKIKLNAGGDVKAMIDQDCITVNADEPNFGKGKWTAQPAENVIIDNENSSTTQVCFINKEETQLFWNITSKNQDTTGVITLRFEPLRISQGFSPNEDGLNDKFEVIGLSPETKIAVTILNKWGQIVFETDDYNTEKWDGTNSNRENLPNDSYIYNIDIEGVGKQSGTVVLRK